MNSTDPIGRAMNASANTANDSSIPVSRSYSGNISCGKTSTEAMP